MNHRGIKATAYVLAAALAFSGAGISAQAAGSGALFSGGVDIAFANGNKLENISGNTTIPIESIVEWVNIDETETAKAPSAESAEEELYRNLVIAQVNKYVNVRDLPGEDGQVIKETIHKFDGPGVIQGQHNRRSPRKRRQPVWRRKRKKEGRQERQPLRNRHRLHSPQCRRRRHSRQWSMRSAKAAKWVLRLRNMRSSLSATRMCTAERA